MLVEPLAGGEMNKRQQIRLETGWSHERQLHNRYWSHKKKRVTDTGDWSHEWQQILLEPQDEEQEDNHHWGATSNRYRSHKRRQQILKTGAMNDRKYWTTTTGDNIGAMEPQATTNRATRTTDSGATNDKANTVDDWSNIYRRLEPWTRTKPILEPGATAGATGAASDNKKGYWSHEQTTGEGYWSHKRQSRYWNLVHSGIGSLFSRLI